MPKTKTPGVFILREFYIDLSTIYQASKVSMHYSIIYLH